MVELWFAIASVMLAVYVVMDGFDFGRRRAAPVRREDGRERRQVLAAIGPYWDGNEVWLLASAASCSSRFRPCSRRGCRGSTSRSSSCCGRSSCAASRSSSAVTSSPLWRAAWDFVFAAASLALPVLFGAALGNLLRGLPLDQAGWFSLALFTDFTARARGHPRLVHRARRRLRAAGARGARGTFLAWKTDGPVQERSRRIAMLSVRRGGCALPLATATDTSRADA